MDASLGGFNAEFGKDYETKQTCLLILGTLGILGILGTIGTAFF
jgi:hypothetical protein